MGNFMQQLLLYIVIGAIAGSIAGAIIKLAGPRINALNPHPQWQRYGAIIAGAVAGVIVFAIGIAIISGGASREQKVLDEIRSYRFIQVLEKHQPGAREQIEALVHDAVSKNDPSIAQARATQLAQQYFPQYVPRTSDDAIVGFAKNLVDVLTYFETNDAETCKSLATGGTMAGKNVPTERMLPIVDSMADVIQDAATKPQAPPDAARATPLVQSVVAKLYAGNDPKLIPPQMLVTPAAAPADRLCYTMRSFYATVLSLPKADASLVLRQLISGTMK